MGLDVNTLPEIDCDSDGGFAPVQCESDRCFCVDQRTGLELPGTRARSLEFVNCSGECLLAGLREMALRVCVSKCFVAWLTVLL